MEAFAKSDDERDFFLDRQEGFLIFVDLDKGEEDLEELYKELQKNQKRYSSIPKLSFYETKKIMEGFVNEKVYDIDTKEKLLEIIQLKDARENFLEFIFEHHTELDKWQQFYQERSRIRIIEWLRNNHFHFVFEEDLELIAPVIEKLKTHLFDSRVSKEIQNARKSLTSKAKTYYSSEALNPRPKRGRPPKQTIKPEVDTKLSIDIYSTVPKAVRTFLFIPNITGVSVTTFSSKFDTEEDLIASRKVDETKVDQKTELNELNEKLETLRSLSQNWIKDGKKVETKPPLAPEKEPSPPKKKEPKKRRITKAEKPQVEEKKPATKKKKLQPATKAKAVTTTKKTKLREAPKPKKVRLKKTGK